MSRGLLVARIAAVLVVIVAAGFALDWFVAVPLRCSHAASVGAAELDNAGDAVDEQSARLVRRIGASLQGSGSDEGPERYDRSKGAQG